MYVFELCFSLDIGPGAGLQDYMEALFLVFKGTFILFSILAVPSYVSTNSVGESLFSTPFIAFIINICRLFDVGPSDWCEVIFHSSFDLHFSNNSSNCNSLII